uniref:SH2 domain-containing protein 4B-like n=1 Tax=Sinocyclocheilus rhinocerous TaxID=307959 RepID=A0A673I0K1_9TELE
MMQQILRDMFVDPELLAELNEEQRQILFYKIRQEQVRRWTERESQEEGWKRPLTKERNGDVQWLQGRDGEVWVWVMGDFPGDKPYEMIVKELMEERARRQAQLEAQELWRKKEEEIKQKFRDAITKEKARLVAGKWKEETDDRKAAKQEEECIQEKLKKQEEEERQREEEEIRRAEEKRAKGGRTCCMQTILSYHFFSIRPFILSTSFLVCRSKAADEEMTRKARWARDEYKRQSLRAIEKGHVAGLSGHFQKQSHWSHSTFIEPSVSPVPSNEVRPSPAWVRTPRPSSREMLILWFTEEQKPKQAGYERNGNAIAPWFHGIISRDDSETLLMNAAKGSFLVRVSEMIWGYTLSYHTASGFKHFLIDASGDYYSFLGVDQNRHATLADLIDFHKVREQNSV